MTTAVLARTARKPHVCETCNWAPVLRGVATILPGHRYLRHVAFPDREFNLSDHPVTMNECASCASEREHTDCLLVMGACGQWCCGDVVCARPHPHDGDHSCRRCAGAS